ncbi:MAG: pentapeptide repeat-containing protein [Nostoc sp.]
MTMTEPQTPEAKDIQTSGGNYSERIGKHYIQAETVHIYETAPNPSTPSTNNRKVGANQKQLAFAIAGSIDEVDQAKLKAILAVLQKISGDATIEIIRVEEGSIKIILNGSDEGLERIKQLFESGELTEVLGTPVEYVNLTALDEKSRLIRDIVQSGASSQNLSNADLSGANLSNADLSGANLSGANLSGANLSGANLSDANLNGVDLHDVVIDETTRINDKWRLVWEITNRASENRELSDADLSEAVLIGANLSGANLSGANLRSTKLNNADLSHGDLQRANLLCTDLNGADLSGANLSSTNLRIVNLSGADLSRVNLSNAKLISDVDLSDANLSDANLSNADLSEANLSRADLSAADLTDANLSNANLSGADLREANLRRADLSRAKVEEAKFGRNKGLTETLKINLEKRGAKFEDSPGDRSLVSLGRPS